jgi:hypothetical protein
VTLRAPLPDDLAAPLRALGFDLDAALRLAGLAGG